MSVPGGEAIFDCSHSQTITGVQWLLNDTALQDLNLRNVAAEFSDIIQVGVLTFTDLPLEYNKTRISCTAITSSGMMEPSSSDVLQLIQGSANSRFYICSYHESCRSSVGCWVTGINSTRLLDHYPSHLDTSIHS